MALIIENGLYFDGLGTPGAVRHLLIEDGVVKRVSEAPIAVAGAKRIDAKGRWVLPGFVAPTVAADWYVAVTTLISSAPAGVSGRKSAGRKSGTGPEL